MLRRLAAIPTAVLMLSVLAACGDDDADEATDPSTSESSSSTPAGDDAPPAAAGSCEYVDAGDAAKDVEMPPAEPTVTGEVPVTISTGLGDITATLDADGAPCTVNSFVSLAEQNYFADTECHRLVTEGIYVLQCGDPTASGMGGPGYTIPDELTGQEDYSAGALAMAKTQLPDSGGSQFFIVYEDSNSGLAKDYTLFGRLDEKSTQLVADVAAAGNADDGIAPKTAVEISGVTIK
ncbi:peptidylprolyl isomerase [Nocardioides pacificus]